MTDDMAAMPGHTPGGTFVPQLYEKHGNYMQKWPGKRYRIPFPGTISVHRFQPSRFLRARMAGNRNVAQLNEEAALPIIIDAILPGV